MGDIDNRKNEDYHIYGIISSNQRVGTTKPYKKLLSNHFQDYGGIVYIYSRKEEREPLRYMKKILGIGPEDLYHTNRIICICREDYVVGNQIDKVKFRRSIENALTLLAQIGVKNNIIYIKVDGFWNYLVGENVQACYNFLKKFNTKGRRNVFLRYIMEEISEEYIPDILENHRCLLVDGIEDFEQYTPEQLIYKSMTLLPRYNFLIHNYEQEMLRLEYLKTLGELMEGTVHDINNLLLTTLGYAQLAMVAEGEEDIKKSLKVIQKTSLDGKIIIDRIRHHIRGNNDTSKSLLKFNEIVETSIEMAGYKFRPSILGQKREVKLVADLNSNRYIYGNEYELRQSLINIILNGADAMGNTGTMTIKAYDSGEQTILDIIDTGCGMDKVTVNNIFNPYFSTKGNRGTGLGLFIAKRIFESHGADVQVESEIGKGTRFSICFPTEKLTENIAESAVKDYNIS